MKGAGAPAAFTDWRRSDDRFSPAEIRETRQIIQGYRGILEKARATMGDRVLGGITMQPADLFGPRESKSPTPRHIAGQAELFSPNSRADALFSHPG
jgi:hypothetical protein